MTGDGREAAIRSAFATVTNRRPDVGVLLYDDLDSLEVLELLEVLETDHQLVVPEDLTLENLKSIDSLASVLVWKNGTQ